MDGRPERVKRIDPAADPELEALLGRRRTRSGLDRIPDFDLALATHPGVYAGVIRAGLGRLPDGALTVRHRELLVLRTARRCGATYEWAHHRRRAAERGLSSQDVAAAWYGPESATGLERVLLETADALHQTSTIEPAAWQRLVAAFGEKGAVEAVTVVGWFHLIAFLGNALELEIEPGVDNRFGPPEAKPETVVEELS